jgi:hypothetical protein
MLKMGVVKTGDGRLAQVRGCPIAGRVISRDRHGWRGI